MIDRKTQIEVRKILKHFRFHDAVKYSGPLYMVHGYYMGEDYEIRDIDRRLGWDSPHAFISKSKTRKNFEKIISILEKKKPHYNFIISRYSYIHNKNLRIRCL